MGRNRKWKIYGIEASDYEKTLTYLRDTKICSFQNLVIHMKSQLPKFPFDHVDNGFARCS